MGELKCNRSKLANFKQLQLGSFATLAFRPYLPLVWLQAGKAAFRDAFYPERRAGW